MVGPFRLPGMGGKILGKIDEKKQKVEKEVKEKVKNIDEKLRSELIKKIIESFSVIKKKGLPFDQAMPLFNNALEKFEGLVIQTIPRELDIKENKLIDGEEGSTGFGDNWGKLHENSRKFLKTGELLYSYLSHSPKSSESEIDFSPVSLEYCKAFENEFVIKLFRDNINHLKNTIETEDAEEFEKKKEYMKTGQLSSDQKHCFRSWVKLRNYMSFYGTPLEKNNSPPTLGQIRFILKYLKEEKIIKEIPLYLDLRKKILIDWEEKFLLGNEFEKSTKEKTSIVGVFGDVVDFRNGSAHISVQTKEDTEKCRKMILENLPNILKTYKNTNEI